MVFLRLCVVASNGKVGKAAKVCFARGITSAGQRISQLTSCTVHQCVNLFLGQPVGDLRTRFRDPYSRLCPRRDSEAGWGAALQGDFEAQEQDAGARNRREQERKGLFVHNGYIARQQAIAERLRLLQEQ